MFKNPRVLISGVVAALIIGTMAFAPALTTVFAKPPGDKVTVCHVPGGFGYGSAQPHTITVGARAVPAHLAHGDSLGACS